MKAVRLWLPILAALLAVLLVGCHPQMPGAAPPPAVQVSPADQSQAEQTSQSYIASLQTWDYKKAETMMSAAFQKATPPARLRTLVQGADRPFLGAKGFQFDPAQPSPHGDRVVLRARFRGGDGKPYRTNFLLTKSGTAWQINGLIPPATHRTPNLQKTHTSSSS